MAFSFGAGIAGLAGSIFAAVQTGAFPQNFGTAVLILIYAVVILGGTGQPDRDGRRRDRDHRVEPGARLDLVADPPARPLLLGPDRGGAADDEDLAEARRRARRRGGASASSSREVVGAVWADGTRGR